MDGRLTTWIWEATDTEDYQDKKDTKLIKKVREESMVKNERTTHRLQTKTTNVELVHSQQENTAMGDIDSDP